VVLITNIRFYGLRLPIDFIETTEPAEVHAERWGALLRSGADEVALPPGRRAAGVRRRPAKSAAARSTG
jgi:hypothetical protein